MEISMIPVLYEKNTRDFTNNGICFLKDTIIAEVSETLNGSFELYMEYPVLGLKCNEIQEERIIKAETPEGPQPFTIHRCVKKNMSTVKIYARHIFYDLLENLIEDTNIVEQPGVGALDQLLRKTQYPHPFKVVCDISKMNNSRIVRRNPVEAILDPQEDNSFVNRWGGELVRDFFDIKMYQQRGTDRGVTIQDQKNLIGFESDVDLDVVVTRIMPKGADGLLLPEKYVDSPLINNYSRPRIKVIEFNHIKAQKEEGRNDEEALPLEEAYKALRAAAKSKFTDEKIDIPQANYKVNFVELSKTEEYKDYAVLERVYLADTVRVKHSKLGVDIQAKAISYVFNVLTEKYKDLNLGSYKKSFLDKMNDVSKITDGLEDMEESVLQQAKNNATNLINSGFGGHVRTYPERILIMDTDSEKTAKKVWQWNINGLGFSPKGINGPYETAMTMDGRIVADFITTGTLDANLIKVVNLVADDIVSGILRSRNNRFRIDLDRSGVDFYSETGKLVTQIAQAKTRQADGSSAEITYFGVSEAEGVATGLAFGKRAADGSFGNSIYIESRYGDVYMRPPTLYIIPSEKMRVEARAEFHHPVRFDASPLSKIEGAMKGEEWTIVPGEGDRGGAAIRPWTSGNGSLGTATHRWQEAWIGWINGQDIGLKFKAITDADFKAGEARRVADWASARVEEVNKIAVNAANAVSGKADASALGWQIARIDNAFARIEALERK
ncbi:MULTISPECIES: phage tail spike protein [Bacillus]|uniref:phage tail spike protein n=1 Tax=Bacillus wiedmannii TaxID=1890302 RepID=UPI000D17AC59|nr:phage tail spike protein [Bacillus wiedmannii]PTC12267.1 endopeptidase [Bacillus wiedmannii]